MFNLRKNYMVMVRKNSERKTDVFTQFTAIRFMLCSLLVLNYESLDRESVADYTV